MTIAIGFKCINGVVLAADSQYSDGTAKVNGPKTFHIPSNGHYCLSVAGSGGVLSLKGIVREIGDRLEKDIGANPASPSDLRASVEDSLRAYYPKHIDSAPKKIRDALEIQLLVAIWEPKRGARLFETCRTNIVEVDGHRCVGVGLYLVEYLKDLFFVPGIRPSVEVAKPLAAYMVAMARRHVEHCGGATQVRALLDDGTDDTVWRHEAQAYEKYYRDFFKSLAHVFGYLGAMPLAVNIDIEPNLRVLAESLRNLKKQQQVFRDAHTALRNPKQ
jgi:hypothetical protein